MRLDDCSLPGVTAIIPYCVVLHRACPSWFPAKGAIIPTRPRPLPAAGNDEMMSGRRDKSGRRSSDPQTTTPTLATHPHTDIQRAKALHAAGQTQSWTPGLFCLEIDDTNTSETSRGGRRGQGSIVPPRGTRSSPRMASCSHPA